MRVHPEILAKQKLPQQLVTKNIWRERFEDIAAIERYLARNGTVILKFFLNVSKEEQRERFLERLEEPAKNWKFSLADIAERALWAKYQAAYQDMIRHTSTTAGAVARGAGRPQMVRPRRDRLDHRRRARQARSAIPRRSTRPTAANSSRCARRCWPKARAREEGGRRSRVGRGALAPCPPSHCGRSAEMVGTLALCPPYGN